ncbi:hypothetical protein [Micromonospora sp. NPDC049171]|uniref:NACHT domain-containing protein n=1 Tax=Micromonospora sp. NPDC049171 TaxID=3155770 RepID=UPI0033F7537C
MARRIGYQDAVKLLGGDTGRVVRLLDTLTGAGLITLLGPVPGVLGWFDAKTELSKITERLVAGLVEHRSHLSRYERTERLQAAQAVLVLTAYFEALGDSGEPFGRREWRLTADEQRSLGGTGFDAAGWSAAVPGPAESHDDFRTRLRADDYVMLTSKVESFVTGLAVWEELNESDRAVALGRLRAVPDTAVKRYDSLLIQLAAEFPEVAFWAGIREQSAVQARLRDMTTALDALREVMETIASGRGPDERRRALARAYAAALSRPIVEPGETPPGITVPQLGEAFLPQLFRAVDVTDRTPLSDEDWWQTQQVRDELFAFLGRFLTQPDAARAPMLVLGQPGSGKSVLGKVLAARLPPTDFLPVLVPLRDVSAVADLQEQIEQAIRIDTGERVEWPALARSAGDAFPVVILDGFDELLQATGVSQTDYLLKAAAFQRREADQGRPVAVIVTSRISVAGRAKPAEGTIALRLEPFDKVRVAAWLAVWNRANDARLDLETVLRYPDLAGQPLLLLMLALFNAQGGSLRDAGHLDSDWLYEQLLDRFARRQVDKLATGWTVRERDRRVQEELRRLSVVAFAMFNRGAQWVSEAELGRDLEALPGLTGRTPVHSDPADLRTPLAPAELAVGSFFFIHRARATSDDARLETFEFLHATFAEYLTARLIVEIVRNMINRERATTIPASGAVDDDLAHALLSFAPLASRRQIVVFVRRMVAAWPEADRQDGIELIFGLFRAATQERAPREFAAYLPRSLGTPARIAAYTSNLLILALTSGKVAASQLLGINPESDQHGHETINLWTRIARIWHAEEEASGWIELLYLVKVDRVRDRGRRDLALSLKERTQSQNAPPVDVAWLLGDGLPAPVRELSNIHSIVRGGSAIRQAGWQDHFLADTVNDLVRDAVTPLWTADLNLLGDGVYHGVGGQPATVLSDLIRLVFGRAKLSQQEARDLYRAALVWLPHISAQGRVVFFRSMTVDADIDAETVADVLEVRFLAPDQEQTDHLDRIRCAAAHLDPVHDPDATLRLAKVIHSMMPASVDDWPLVVLDAVVRWSETDPPLPPPRLSAEQARMLVDRFGARRPDLGPRIATLVDPSLPN